MSEKHVFLDVEEWSEARHPRLGLSEHSTDLDNIAEEQQVVLNFPVSGPDIRQLFVDGPSAPRSRLLKSGKRRPGDVLEVNYTLPAIATSVFITVVVVATISSYARNVPKEKKLSSGVFADCQAAMSKGVLDSSIKIQPSGDTPYIASCDQETAGGGWTFIQRRDNATVSFNQSWMQYRQGFGNHDGNHWLGNDNIHRLTHNRNQSLLIMLGGNYSTFYGVFSVEKEEHFYRLHIGQYQGKGKDDPMLIIDKQPFSTRDVDNDAVSENCAVEWGGFWYTNCKGPCLNAAWGELQWPRINAPKLFPNSTAMLVRGR